jgi:hypothetical protein
MRSARRFASVVLALALGSPAISAERLPDAMLGTWCVISQDPASVREKDGSVTTIYERRATCKPYETDTWLILGQRGYDGHEVNCKAVSNATRVLSRGR